MLIPERTQATTVTDPPLMLENPKMAEKILIIDDEESTIQLLKILLERRGFEVITALRADEGLRQAYRTHPDLVLLDIMMPDMDGWAVCAKLRELSDVPIVFLTARGESKDVVRGLDMGADDFIIKPYDNDELIARIRAHLRRSPNASMSEEFTFDNGDFRLNLINREVRVKGNQIHLTPKEFDLLSALVRNAGRVMPRTELVKEAWGPNYTEGVDSLKLYVHYLRQKIEENPEHPKYILTSRGVGYRFVSQ